MEEKNCMKVKKSISFEKSGEILSIEISLENISPETKDDVVVDFLTTMFERLIEDLKTKKSRFY